MNVLLGVTGSIAAYKACELARLFVKEGHIVDTVLTQGGQEFVGPVQFAGITGGVAYTDESFFSGLLHIELAGSSDLIVVAPATASFISRLARGGADDLLSAVALASERPLLLAPAMHGGMWRNSATRENVQTLRERGVNFAGPVVGELSTLEVDEGRMAEPYDILQVALGILSVTKTLTGRKVLVSYGATREPIDDVRVLSNRSSGRMGRALLSALRAAGAETVAVVAGGAEVRAADQVLRVETARELAEALYSAALACDAVVMNAAVSDFAPSSKVSGKLRRGESLELVLEPTEDILARLARQRPEGQVLVGFALEEGDLAASARAKLNRKGVDMVVACELGTEERATATGAIVTRNEEEPFRGLSKEALAVRVIEVLSDLLP